MFSKNITLLQNISSRSSTMISVSIKMSLNSSHTKRSSRHLLDHPRWRTSLDPLKSTVCRLTNSWGSSLSFTVSMPSTIVLIVYFTRPSLFNSSGTIVQCQYTQKERYGTGFSPVRILRYIPRGLRLLSRREGALGVNQKSVHLVNKNERDLDKLYSSKRERPYDKDFSQQKTVTNTKE